MDAVVRFLREIWPDLWQAIVALFSYHKGRGDQARDTLLEDVGQRADALRRVLDAPRADGLSDDEINAELQRRGLLRVPGEPANGKAE